MVPFAYSELADPEEPILSRVKLVGTITLVSNADSVPLVACLALIEEYPPIVLMDCVTEMATSKAALYVPLTATPNLLPSGTLKTAT
jgi:hypothetical protein